MKFLMLIFLFVLSLSAHAVGGGYSCEIKDAQTLKALKSLKLPGYDHRGRALDVKGALCGHKSSEAFSDLCKINEHKLLILKDSDVGLFVTNKGEVYELSCLGIETEQQEQEQDDGPGHGGSTTGGGGARVNTCPEPSPNCIQ